MAKDRKELKSMVKKWIQKAGDHKTKGALHRQLQVPQEERIPKSLLRKIQAAETGAKVHNPTKTGRRSIPVTTLLKRRTAFALNVGYGRFKRRS
jgi:uncharacterized protein YdeI (YjbR/CyaY-like superfamily)